MTEKIVYEAEPGDKGRYRVEAWDSEAWYHVGYVYDYNDLDKAKHVAFNHACSWGEKARVIDAQPETMAVDAHSGVQDSTGQDSGTIPHPEPETPPNTAHSECTTPSENGCRECGGNNK